MKIITLQPSARTDHITEDGTELLQRPYPFHVAEDGSVQRQDFWQGDPTRIVGFTAKPEPGNIVLDWEDAVLEPQRAVGLYMVSENAAGKWASHVIAVAEVRVSDDGPEV